MKYKIHSYSIHELGQRQNQEDSIFPCHQKSTPDDRLFILCDGMGGHEKGEVASGTVCETMSRTILSHWTPEEPFSDELLRQALNDAYDALDAKDNGEEKKMGTTMTFVCFHRDGVTVAHIGDSRVYQIRPVMDGEPARIMFQTRDHSLVNDLIKIGEITEEEAKKHPQKNVITRAMQPCQPNRAKADIAHITDVRVGDYFFMCSDGMLEQTSDDNLLYIITKPDASDTQKVSMLCDVTSENKDNHTAYLIKVEEVGTEPCKNVSHPEPKDDSVFAKCQGLCKYKPFLYGFLCGVLVLAICAGAYFAYNHFMSPEDKVSDTDSTEIKAIDSAKVTVPPTSERKKDEEAAETKEESSTESSNDTVKSQKDKSDEPIKVDSCNGKKIDASSVDIFARELKNSFQKGKGIN